MKSQDCLAGAGFGRNFASENKETTIKTQVPEGQLSVMKTTMKNLAVSVFMTIMAATAFTSCSKDVDDIKYDGTVPEQTVQKAKAMGMQRTVLVYMVGRNNLSLYATADLNEMLEGSKKLADDLALIVFMRRCHNGEEPWLARIQKGQLTDKVTLQYLVPNYPRLV